MELEDDDANVVPPGTALAVAPAELSQDDRRRVEDAVAWLSETVRESGTALAVRVRDYILRSFFDGRYEAFAALDPTKPTSFNALAAREDLPFARSTLYTLIRVGQQLDGLPSAVGQRLTMRHHRALLPVVDPALRSQLAEQAAEQGWTVAQLTDAVREQQPPTRPGRKPLPRVLKDFRAFRRAVQAHKVPSQAELAKMPAEQRRELSAALKTLDARIAALRKALAEPPEG